MTFRQTDRPTHASCRGVFAPKNNTQTDESIKENDTEETNIIHRAEHENNDEIESNTVNIDEMTTYDIINFYENDNYEIYEDDNLINDNYDNPISTEDILKMYESGPEETLDVDSAKIKKSTKKKKTAN